jgi:hypothetical protein
MRQRDRGIVASVCQRGPTPDVGRLSLERCRDLVGKVRDFRRGRLRLRDGLYDLAAVIVAEFEQSRESEAV